MLMPNRALGATGVSVPPVGLGAGSLGEGTEAEAHALLDGALALGAALVDAARSYGEAESRIGRYPRRSECLLSTKVGYGVEGVPDWTGAAVAGGVDRALRVLSVERIDVVFLHSCPRSVLEAGEVVEALTAARDAGKIRLAGYSGDGDGLDFAVDCRAFDVVQASFNLADRANRSVLERARAAGLGVMAKRPLANAAWRGPGAEPYGARWAALGLDGDDPAALAARYAAHHGPADMVLVGTRRLAHLEAAARAVAAGPLDEATAETLEARYAERGSSWPPVI